MTNSGGRRHEPSAGESNNDASTIVLESTFLSSGEIVHQEYQSNASRPPGSEPEHWPVLAIRGEGRLLLDTDDLRAVWTGPVPVRGKEIDSERSREPAGRSGRCLGYLLVSRTCHTRDGDHVSLRRPRTVRSGARPLALQCSGPGEQPVTVVEYQPDFLDRSEDFVLWFKSSG